MNARETRITRLAPSPTGAMHLGNARTFLLNWALARQLGWRVVLRIEDLDGPRVKPGADQQAIEDLRWLGIDWDQGPTWQRNDLAPYREALEKLRRAGLTYPCICTRGDIERASSAPHGEAHELRYPGTCRPMGREQLTGNREQEEKAEGPSPQPTTSSLQSDPAWRLIVPDEEIEFVDQVHGPQRFNVQQQVGDFLVATKAGVPAYQLGVVVDDARAGVTDVVRGDDLLSSTARQCLLYRVLGLGPLPCYWHLPLVLGPDGRRLAKRHGDTRLAWFRAQGVAPQRIIGLVARWSGLIDRARPVESRELVDCLDIARLPRTPVTFTTEDLQWLLAKPDAKAQNTAKSEGFKP
jgi:glutamyl-tRNA synthetase